MSQQTFFKVIIVGNFTVGKSSLMRRLCFDRFQEKYEITVGVEFESKEIIVDGDNVQLQVWDTAGQDKFRSLVRVFFQGADAVFLAYAINDRKSFDIVSEWLNEARSKATPDSIYILVGTKSDLEQEERIIERREVEYEEGLDYMSEHGLDIFFETSSKTGNNVEKVFQEATRQIIQRKKTLGHLSTTRTATKSSIILPDISLEKQTLEFTPQNKKKKCSQTETEYFF